MTKIPLFEDANQLVSNDKMELHWSSKPFRPAIYNSTTYRFYLHDTNSAYLIVVLWSNEALFLVFSRQGLRIIFKIENLIVEAYSI